MAIGSQRLVPRYSSNGEIVSRFLTGRRGWEANPHDLLGTSGLKCNGKIAVGEDVLDFIRR
jgi:hypothetical protein